ncbi:hypothetical protein MNBD_UNCLBAC01-1820 [hydrothermal vent metagenome]|uniref:Uncharacterized protein n=1 Tax=hydrothermal vent metagenome TaxID=652676 RepID=A0A3B1DJK1_9ZZZZ
MNFLDIFLNSFYIPEKNLFKVGEIANWNVYGLFYCVFFGFLIVACILKFFLKKFRFQQYVFFVCCFFLFLTVGVQTIHRHKIFKEDYKKFHGKTLQEKISVRFENTYRFAQYCRTNLPGKHWGDPVTDMDIQKNMLTFFSIAYYLYPLDIRIGKEHSKDSLVIFLKEDPLKAVPAGFKAFEPFDSTSLLAVKEK